MTFGTFVLILIFGMFFPKAFFRKLLFFGCLLCFPVFLFAQAPGVKQLWLDNSWLEKEIVSKLEISEFLQDAKGLMWFATDAGLIQFDGANFKIYQHDPNNANSLFSSSITKLIEDDEGKIWIATRAHGISVFDPELEKFENYRKSESAKNSLGNNFVNFLTKDQNGVIWVGTEGDGWCKFNADKNNFDCFLHDNRFNFIKQIIEENDTTFWIFDDGINEILKWNPVSQLGNIVQLLDEQGKAIKLRVKKVLHTRENNIWLHTWDNKFYKLKNGEKDDPNQYIAQNLKALEGYGFYDIMQAKNGEIWAVVEGYLVALNPADCTILPLQLNGLSRDFDLQQTWSLTIFEDNRGYLWMSTEKGILRWSQTNEKPFENYSHFPIQDNPIYATHKFPYVMCIEKLDSQRLLIGKMNGLYVFDKNEKSLSFASQLFPVLDIFDDEPIYLLFRDSHSCIWVVAAINGKGFNVYQFEPKTKKLLLYGHMNRGAKPEIIETKQGALWIGTWSGLIYLEPEQDMEKFYKNDPIHHYFDILDGKKIGALLLENDSLLWIGTEGSGLNCMNTRTGKIKTYQYDPDNLESISNNRIVDLFIDSGNDLWIATFGGGLCRFIRKSETFERFLDDPEQAILNTCAILEDDEGYLWISSSNGISKFDKNTSTFKHYGGGGGLPVSRYKTNAKYKDDDGRFYFGSLFGFTRFLPSEIKADSVIPKIILSEFTIFNEKQAPGETNSPIQKSISYTKSIILKHNQNFLGFKFSALNFTKTEKNQYAYRMEGLIEDWQYLGNKPEVNFTNLDPGDYLLQVKGSNHDGVWNEEGASLKITILPPWYHTWWAYGLWSAIFVGSIYWVYRFQLNRRLAKAKAQRLKELDLAKSRLYTNITHEFRTPLTIILGMADQVKNDPKNWFNEGIKLIRRNGKQLLNLVNQLLDLSKLDSNNMPVKMINNDIVSFVQYLSESFHSYADSKDIRLHFDSDFPKLHMDYDPEKMQNIISNLLSNAIKFTPSGGDVYLGLRQNKEHKDQLLLQIRDNGVGIASEHLPNIFDRFYQVDSTTTRRGEGTGIGLALTKELVKILNGEINVESGVGKGTKFTILLPITQNAKELATENKEKAFSPIAEYIVSNSNEVDSTTGIVKEEESLVLLIEDNADVITYLASFLSGEYIIETAFNGQEGIEKAIELTPDLIVSDVMMPLKDGFEVCSTLKQDERTSHIPIILLTAKSDQTAKLEGLSHGADVYISKPFNKEELLVRIEKLIELRKNLQSHYQQFDDLIKINRKQHLTSEDIFLQKVLQIVNKNLSDEHFGLPDLCRKAGLSRSQLFRKLKALTGKSTTHFIRSIRLTKGKELLQTTDLNVSEIAYQVGFGSAVYFSKSFSEEYGFPPIDIRKK